MAVYSQDVKNRFHIENKLSGSLIEKIQESRSLSIQTTNYTQENKEFIDAGIAPLEITTYYFENDGLLEPLKRV